MRALMLLYGLQTKATFRRLFRGIRSPKGIFVALFFVAALSVFVITTLLKPSSGPAPLNAKLYMPFMLLAYFIYSLLSSIGDRSIYFSPSEVEHLFPAPFHRKTLLGYKMFSWLVVSASMALFFCGAFVVYYDSFVYPFFGMTLTLFFLTLLDMFATLVGQIASASLFSRGRKLIALGCLLVLALGISQSAFQLGLPELSDMNSTEVWFQTVSDSYFGRVILAPFHVFANIVFAPNLTAFLSWVGVALAMELSLIVGILLLDANFLESADAISKKVYERIQNMQTGTRRVSKKSAKWSPRMLPYLNGFGPIAWRQLVSTFRGSKYLFLMGIVLAVGLSIPVIMQIQEDLVSSPKVVAIAFGIMAYLTFIISMGLRNEMNYLEVFKSLPVNPFFTAAGLMTGTVVLFATLHVVMTLIGMLATRNYFEWWVTGYCFIVLFDILLVAFSHTLFLVFPIKESKGAKGIEAVGQNFLVMFFQGFGFMVVSLAAVPAGMIFWLSGNVWIAIFAAWVFVFVFALISIYLCGWVFARFDITRILH